MDLTRKQLKELVSKANGITIPVGNGISQTFFLDADLEQFVTLLQELLVVNNFNNERNDHVVDS